MTCDRCGSRATGRLCADCEQMDRVERQHAHREPDEHDESDEPDEPGHAGSVVAQLRQAARDGDLPDEFAGRVPEVETDE